MHIRSFGLAALCAVPALASAQATSTRADALPFLVRGFANDPAGTKAAVHTDRLIVAFSIPVQPALLDGALVGSGLRRVGGAWNGTFEVLACTPGTAQAWAEWFRGQAIVRYAEPDAIAHTCANPDDPYFNPYQWNFFAPGTVSAGAVSNYGVDAVTAWDRTTGSGVTVAVVDTGIAYETFGAFTQAPDLAGASFVWPKDFVNNDDHPNDDNGHGTHVAGTVRQSTNNGLGVAGLAYQCNLMPVKVLNASGSGSHSAIANGITWAADHGAKVINLSLGGSTGSTTLESAVNYAWGKGCVVVAASGNTGRQGVQYPARYGNCIAVGTTRFDGRRPRYGTYGSGLDLCAPGGDTSVDQNGDGYKDGILQQTFASGSPTTFGYYFFQGTSMASPHVAGIAALVAARYGSWSNAQIRSRLEASCRDLGSAGYDTTYGYGLLSAEIATR